MPNDPSSISPKTHAVVAVRGIGNVAVPYGTPLNALHAAIVKHEDYSEPAAPIVPNEVKPLDTISAPVPNITAEGAIENSPAFKKAAQEAWDRTRVSSHESGFTTNRDGKVSKVQFAQEEAPGYEPTSVEGSLIQNIGSNTGTALHTHPTIGDSKPSAKDVATAKQIKIPVMVASKDGLYEIDALGNVRQVFSSPDWMNSKKKGK